MVYVGACQCSKSVGFRGVGVAGQKCSFILSGEGRVIERALKGARLPPTSGARARGEMDAGGLACAAIGTCLRTFFTPNGDKTGWTAAEWEGNEHAEADDQTKVRLIDGREVPRVKGWYKHLGVRAQTANGWGEARAVVIARCSGMAAALARLGIMSAEEYVDTIDTATLSVVAYYGAAFPIGRKACEEIDVAKRRGLERLGHAGTRAARWLVHSPRPEELGMAMAWPHAAAALVVEMDNAYNAEAQAPARVAAAARTAKVYWQLGWRPMEEARVPLAWNPWHTVDMLSEESIIEAALKYRLTAGVATVAARGDGARSAMADGYTIEEGASATPIWKKRGVSTGGDWHDWESHVADTYTAGRSAW